MILPPRIRGAKEVVFSVLFIANGLLLVAQDFPVQIIPQAVPPAPIYLSNYADASTVNSPLRAQVILNDFTIPNREIRLKTYFEGNGIALRSNDIVIGADPLFLEGGIPLNLTNVELAPYFRFENITGVSPTVYGRPIPEGAYQFCFELYDALTGNRLSRRSCATTVVFQNEPPFLVTPYNNTNIDEHNPQNIVFQWTPRHINVGNVEYELSLVEIWDNQINPQAAFLSSPPVFQVTTTATTYVYGPVDPLLLSGKNYAWRVQAKAKQGTEEIGLFKNQGYSEIYSFSYAGSCDSPLSVNHEVKGSTNANIFWDDFATDIPEFTVRYRKKSASGSSQIGGNEWFLSKTTSNTVTLWDLKAGTTYEYQVQKKCTVTKSEWGAAKTFTTFIADDEESVYECGISPDINLNNKEPLPNITSGDKFTAGDFPITIAEVNGSNGRFSGKGYVTIPYLNSIKVGVAFTNVLINTDKQLAEGTVVTMYDPSLKNILDVDEAIDTVDNIADLVAEPFEGDNDLDEIKVDFKINPEKDIKVENGMVTITNPQTGVTVSEPLGDDKVVVDSSGQVYHIDAEGNVSTGGMIAEGGAVNPENVDGVTKNGELDSLTAKGIVVTFESTDGVYGFDELPTLSNNAIKQEYVIIKDGNGDDYKIPHQAVEKGKTATITAKVKLTSKDYSLDDIIFKTKQGEKLPAETKGNKTIELTLNGNYSFENETIYAVVPSKEDSDKQLTAGAFTLCHLTDRAIDVVLVSVNGANIPDGIEADIQRIFKKGVTTLNISTDEDDNRLDASILGSNDLLDIGESAWLTNYNDEQKAVIATLKPQIAYNRSTYYLFVFGNDVQPSKPIGGFMPLQRQFGFVFNGDVSADEEGKGNLAKTIAHEIGHGVFALRHPFDQYGSGEESTNWLMDYADGALLSHMDWAQLHNPELKFYVFQDDEDGELAGKIWFTPDWEPMKVGNSSTIITKRSEHINGTVWGFRLSDGTKYSAAYSNGSFTGYETDNPGKENPYPKSKWLSNIQNGDEIHLFDTSMDCPRIWVAEYDSTIKNYSDYQTNGKILRQGKKLPCEELCADGMRFYEEFDYLIKNNSESEKNALWGMARLVCSDGPDAIGYDILVAQMSKDASEKVKSFFNGREVYEFNLAREMYWQGEDALANYLIALERVNNNIQSYSTKLDTDATKEDYYAALYYLNDRFLRTLSFSKKKELVKLLFEHNFFITDDFLKAGKSDVALIKKIVNTIDESDINQYLSDLIDDKSEEFTQSNREVLLEICNALELELLSKANIEVKVEALKRLLKGSKYKIIGRNYHDIISKVVQSVKDSEAVAFLNMLEDEKYGYDNKPLVFHLKESLSDLFSLKDAYTEFFAQLIRLTAAKAEVSPNTFEIVAELDWKVENRDYVLIRVVRDKSKYKYSYDEVNHKVQLTTCKEIVSTTRGGLKCIEVENIMPSDASLFDFVMVYFYKDASPFSPIASKSIYDEESELEAQGYVIPALFLEYMQNETNEARIENVLWNTFDIVMTVATVGEGTMAIKVVRVAASSGRKLLRRNIIRQGYALMDFVYTVGDNTYQLSTGNQLPEYVQNIGYLFAAKGTHDLVKSGLRGLKGLRALKQLSDEEKMKAIKEYLKISRGDDKIITIEEVNEFMTTAEQKILSSKNVQWKDAWESTKTYKIGDVLASSITFNKSIIKSKRGFVNQIDELLAQGGLTIDDFHYMMQKSSNALTETEKAVMTKIRTSIPKPNSTSVMQKVIPKSDIEKYLDGTKGIQVKGYITKAADAKHLESFEDLYYGLRLDYTGTQFFVEDGSCAIIRFTSENTKSAIIPSGGNYAKYEYPFTAHGFTAGKNQRLGSPEWHLQNNIDLNEGAEIWKVLNDGTETILARLEKVGAELKFVKVE